MDTKNDSSEAENHARLSDYIQDIHAGRPLRRQPIKLEEVKALQKAKTLILESRVH